MTERAVLGVSVADQAREILWGVLNDSTVRESVKDALRRRMALHPDRPDWVLLEHLLERQRRSASRNPARSAPPHPAEVWPL